MADDAGFFPIPEEYQNTPCSLLRRIKITQIEMCGDRGYRGTIRAQVDVEETLLSSTDFTYFTSTFNCEDELNKGDISVLNATYKDIEGVFIGVYFLQKAVSSSTISNTQISEVVQEALGKDEGRIILIISNKLSSKAKEVVLSGRKADIKIEVFSFADLCYNVNKHVLVPKHVALSLKDSKVWFRERPMLDSSTFPRILVSDPVVRYYSWEPGQLVKIYRLAQHTSAEVVHSLYYRLVSY